MKGRGSCFREWIERLGLEGFQCGLEGRVVGQLHKG